MITAALVSAILFVPAAPGHGTSDFLTTRAGSQFELRLADGPVFRKTNSPVMNLRTLHVGEAERVATWTEAGRPFYAITTDGVGVQRVTQSATTIDLWYKSFDPVKTLPNIPASLTAGAGNEIFIVQFVSQPLQQYVSDIEGLGGKVYNYTANQAYLVRMDGQTRIQVSNLPYVRWVGPYHPAYRIDPSLIARLNAGTLPARDVYNMLVFETDGAQKGPVSDRIRSIGGTVIDNAPYGHIVVATFTPDQLRQAAGWNEIMWIDRWTPLEPDMDIAREFGGANYLFSVTGFSGQGVRGQVRDIGCLATHVDFQSRPLIIRNNNADGTHGTCTTGIIFGDGTGNPMGKGMLPAAQGIFLGNPGGGFPTTGAARFADTQPLVQSPYFGVFESNSTGSSQITTYDAESANMDDIIFRLDLLICQSQSNLGTQQSRPQAWAKNIVSVGGINHFNTLTRTDDSWGGASIGPASDGRIKPDLSHFYDNIFCTYSSSNTSYISNFGGTSGATPITCGHFGLLFQMWANGIFGQTITGTTVFDARPHAMTAKALMVNTATQYPFTGTGANLTRVHQGWGTAQVDNLYNFRNKMFVVNEDDIVTPLGTNTYPLYVAAGEPAFRATMVYKDLPGNPANQTQHRVNNLDLKVTAPDGTIYWGNNGLTAGNWSTSGGTGNTKDTVENVFVQNPAAGVWTVQILGTEIVADSHVQTVGVIDSDYALVVTGVTSSLNPTSFTLERGLVLSGTTNDMATSNNVRYNLRPGPVISSAEAPVRLVAEATSPTNTLSNLSVRLEASVNQANLGQTIEVYNFSTNQYDLADTRAATTSDSTVNVSVAPANHLNGSGLIRVRISYKQTAPILSYPWTVGIDQLRVNITP